MEKMKTSTGEKKNEHLARTLPDGVDNLDELPSEDLEELPSSDGLAAFMNGEGSSPLIPLEHGSDGRVDATRKPLPGVVPMAHEGRTSLPPPGTGGSAQIFPRLVAPAPPVAQQPRATIRGMTVAAPSVPAAALATPVVATTRPPAPPTDSIPAGTVRLINHELLAGYLLAPGNGAPLVMALKDAINAAADKRHGDIATWKQEALALVNGRIETLYGDAGGFLNAQLNDIATWKQEATRRIDCLIEQKGNRDLQAAEDLRLELSKILREGVDARKKEMADAADRLAQATKDLSTAQEKFVQGDLNATALLATVERTRTQVEALTAQVGEAHRGRKSAEEALVGYQDLVKTLLDRVEASDRHNITINAKAEAIATTVEKATKDADAARKAARQARSERPYKTGVQPWHAVIGGVMIALMTLSGVLIATRGSGSSGTALTSVQPNATPVASEVAPAPVVPPTAEAPVAQAVEAKPAPHQNMGAPQAEETPKPAAIATSGGSAALERCTEFEAAEKPQPGADGRYIGLANGRRVSCAELSTHTWTASQRTTVLCGCR